MHVRASFEDLASLVPGPDHEGVHGALDVWLVIPVLACLSDDLGAEHLGCLGGRRLTISVVFLRVSEIHLETVKIYKVRQTDV